MAPVEFQPLSLKCVLQCFLLLLLSYTINAWPNLVFLPVGNLHQFLKMIERSDHIISKIFDDSLIKDILTSLPVSLTFVLSGQVWHDLLDRVQKRVVSIVGSGFSSDLQALSHRSDVASLSMFYKYYYGKCSSQLADLVPPKRFSAFLSRCIVIQLILLCAELRFIDQAFFLAHQLFGTPSLMNAFHQITISQHSRGELTSSCC